MQILSRSAADKIFYIADNVAGKFPIVHGDNRRVKFFRHVKHFAVNIVYNISTGAQGKFGNFGLVRVNGNWNAEIFHRGKNFFKAGNFGFGVNRREIRARGFCANVKDISAVGN